MRRGSVSPVGPAPINKEGGVGVGGGRRIGHTDRPDAMHATKDGGGGVADGWTADG